MSYDDWRNLAKVEKEKAAPKLKAATVTAQLNKAITALADGNFSASVDETTELVTALRSAFEKFGTFGALLAANSALPGKKVITIPGIIGNDEESEQAA
ncbi:hypothetical protein D9M70_481150 [compost metagenome]